ncbi:MAG: type I restriction endonuclease subunit R [Rickettsiales bacterium]|jgi:type I restriction enzyme R subunit|nr:type I restriction endonuclease subunit R [Rickettsiales bacterium]
MSEFLTPNSQISIVSQSEQSTVIAEYKPTDKLAKSYQTEADLEKELINILKNNGYEYLDIKNNDALISNLRTQISKLNNNFTFSDSEWSRFMSEYLCNKGEGIEEKTRKIQEDERYSLKLDNGSTKNIAIIDKQNIHNNNLQVVNQYETDGGNRDNRYDVSILVNGLPLCHIELKRRGVAIREAFNQINRYQRDSFWADSGLFEFAQLFIISNGMHTKYYSNTTRFAALKERKGRSAGRKTSNSFEFTSRWADAKNKRIDDLADFAKIFLSKHTLLAVLTKYCVFTSDKLLLVMRPYQIAASEAILTRIAMATNRKKLGATDAGGYIWHTTGSGKTLTSFKTAQLASRLNYIDKVLFVVDRKDLDYQTMKEYDKFQKGAANSNASTAILTRQLSDSNVKIIITTIQKLDKFINANNGSKIFNKHIVLIFDECHRSQFGDMHIKITKTFKKYYIFGFTGTPIFSVNAQGGGNPQLRTTEQAFGNLLHDYTIVDAINDENVLPFRVDYINTLKIKEGIKDKQVRGIDVERAANAPERISKIVAYILEHFNQKTKRNEYYTLKDRRLAGFNSILATSSIDAAKLYYSEFVKQMANLPDTQRLKVALIYSFGANDAEAEDGILPDEDFDTDSLDKTNRDFLDNAINNYNETFKTNFDTNSANFQNYYKDLSQKVKDRDIDLLIVVNMFLTGFDATTLNTLWVDKNLRYHGLLQAFSRTNRILNSVKTFGNIVCFRDLEQAAKDAIAIFGDKDIGGIVILRSYADYYNGWDEDGKRQSGYSELIAELQKNFSLPVGEQAEKDFIRLYGAILRMKNILSSFDDFTGQEILTEREFQDYQSAYLDLYDKFRKNKDGDKEQINDDIVFEMELVKQITINIDYILTMVEKYHKSKMKDKKILIAINKATNASVELRSKRELIENFISGLNANTNVEKEWKEFTNKNRTADLDEIIKTENLKPEPTRKFIEDAFRDGEIKAKGTDFAGILPPSGSIFNKNNALIKKKSVVLQKLLAFFEKYFGI